MMRCPIDGAELKIADRQGIEIDYCPQCRGVWLDRGELDKIIDRAYGAPAGNPETAVSGQETPSFGVWAEPHAQPQHAQPQHGYPPQPNYPPQNQPPQPNYPPQNQPPQPGAPNPAQSIVPAIGGLIAGIAASQMSKGHHGHYGHRKRKKHKGWFDEMFDFDD